MKWLKSLQDDSNLDAFIYLGNKKGLEILHRCHFKQNLMDLFVPGIFRSCTIAILFLSLPSGLHGSDTEKDLEKQLKPIYEGETYIIRHFYTGNHIKYDAVGALTSKAESGPWTLYGLYEIENLAIKKKKIELKGKRLCWSYNSGNQSIQFNPFADRTKVEVKLSGSPLNVHSVQKVLEKVFLPNYESLYEEVPSYWKNLVRNMFHSDKNPFLPVLPKLPPRSAEIATEPKILSHKMPIYTEPARQVRAKGILVLIILINKEGHAIVKDIQTPFGLGMEESAIEALSEWKFTPAYNKKNEPVDMETPIEFSFDIF